MLTVRIVTTIIQLLGITHFIIDIVTAGHRGDWLYDAWIMRVRNWMPEKAIAQHQPPPTAATADTLLERNV